MATFLINTKWSRGEVWSSRRPVKAEVAGSNPVGTASHTKRTSFYSFRKYVCGWVAQSVEHTPEKRGVTGSTPVPATNFYHIKILWGQSLMLIRIKQRSDPATNFYNVFE